ncbi:hypothetical protein CASFOL_040771 [Castilleja foliolosa]|uniref:Uncharacterized protein n=1 Tax=Castilleja foliolosa TaxID=1961234 RepID=A0ABD3BCK1_9LAMI
MAGNVYLRTNRFEVKLEGITFKRKDFEYLCSMDFLFPEGRVWDHPPVVGLDVIRHPRDPSVLLILLCFGIGCVILKFVAGEALPAPIHRFLADKRIHFVGFGIPEKKDLFPFKELGLTKNKVDIGYLAAKVLKQPKCKTWELADLARKVLGIKKMVGMTEASSFERHEQIKSAICQLFITSVIASGLLRANRRKKPDVQKKSSFLKKLDGSLHLIAGSWFKLPKSKKKNETAQVEEEEDSIHVHIGEIEDMFGDDFIGKESPFSSSFNSAKIQECNLDQDDSLDDPSYGDDKEGDSSDNVENDFSNSGKAPLKGILKCPSKHLLHSNSSPSEPISPTAQKELLSARGSLRRANSKGCNVRFTCQ